MVMRAGVVVSVLLIASGLPLANGVHAGAGWYLLRPPVTFDDGTGGWVPASASPLRQWEQLGAFDNAQECEIERRQVGARADREYDEIKLKLPADASPKSLEVMRAIVLLAIAFNGRCIASDDPRLK